MANVPPSGELDGQRFINFVDTHSSPYEGDLIDTLRTGRYAVKGVSLAHPIPFDRVETEVYHTGEAGDHDPETVHRAVSLKHGHISRYVIVYANGEFSDYTDETGSLDVRIEHAAALSLIATLERYEAEGKLIEEVPTPPEPESEIEQVEPAPAAEATKPNGFSLERSRELGRRELSAMRRLLRHARAATARLRQSR